MTGAVHAMVLIALALALAFAATSAAAMTVERFEVGQRGAGYYVQLVAHLQAAPKRVLQVLADYRRYPELNPLIIEARMVGEGGADAVLYTRLRGCLGWLFCRDMERYERVTVTGNQLLAEAIAGRGDVVSGRTETLVEADGAGAKVTYRNEFEPSFWMPRWLLEQSMRQTLKVATRQLFENVEKRAGEALP
jgi:hypothetical protein